MKAGCTDAVNWCLDEFKSISFGDKRLDNRFKKVVGHLSEKPKDSICKALENWDQAKAAYRLFENEKVDRATILETHYRKTFHRCCEYKQVLAIQDTSYLDYNSHKKTTGLGPITTTGSGKKSKILGLIMHSVFAVSTDGIPLGLVNQSIWARKKLAGKEARKTYRYGKRDIKEKESYKWIEAFHKSKIRESCVVEFITVADREADIYELLKEFRIYNSKFLIRACVDRRINKKRRRESKPKTRLWQFMSEQPVRAEVEFNAVDPITAVSRKAKCSIKYAEMSIPPPANRTAPKNGSDLSFVNLHAVYVKENTVAKGLEWMLLTNIPIKNKTDALEKVNWYSLRWNIEHFHKILKSGCSVEHCQLGTAEKLKKFIALKSVIAWRIFWMSRINRTRPNEKCTAVMSSQEWKALYCLTKRTKKLPKKIPSTNEVITWIAKLGGYLDRKNDGPPGFITIWRGWERFSDFAFFWALMNEV